MRMISNGIKLFFFFPYSTCTNKAFCHKKIRKRNKRSLCQAFIVKKKTYVHVAVGRRKFNSRNIDAFTDG